MHNNDQSWLYLCGGALGSILLGMGLVPLREATNSGNFVFAFMILILVVSEFGGRWAAIVTATCSALSLNFFLTQPYLSLRIAGKHDLIAFAGLTVCGLVAAALGTRRGETIASLKDADLHLGLMRAALRRAQEPEPLPARLEKVLQASREALPVAGLVLRSSRGEVLATSGLSPAPRPDPAVIVRPDTLVPEGSAPIDPSGSGFPLPAEGGRLAIEADGRQVGWLDLWGNGEPAGAESRRTLTDVARLLAVMLPPRG